MTTQENRLIEIDTPLGPDVLLLTEFSGSEGISTLFNYQLTMISERHDIEFEKIIGKKITLIISLANGNKRFINGVIISFSHVNSGENNQMFGDFSTYSATMTAWPWLLTQTADLRIFQELSIPEIAEKIFTEKGFNDFALRLHDKYEKRNYCVQYRETDFNFICRLLEDEGIFYFFEHTPLSHTLILADSPAENAPCPEQDLVFYELNQGGFQNDDAITDLELEKTIRPGKITLNDYNFETPTAKLQAESVSKIKLGPGEREIYDYPAEYAKHQEGDRLANIQMQVEEAQITTISGQSNCRVFAAGYKFTLGNYYRDDMNDKAYLLTTVIHNATQSGYRSGNGEATYSNNFTCIPHETPFRPQRVTPKPIVEGVHTAIVVGPEGEEIFTDKHGRIKVQFHWDREGKADENTTCWMRVSQAMAGNNWGTMYLPRVGHEVIVNFIDGDPDRPLITGQLYHGNNMPPYTLPDNKTMTTFKSNSSPDGDGFNEIRFEDKKGEEQVFIHAENNMDIRVKSDLFETVSHDRHLHVENDKREKVDNNRNEEIGNDHIEKIGKDHHLNVAGKEATQVGESRSLTVNGDVIDVFKANHSEQTTNDYYLKADNVVIEGMTNVTVKVGGSYIAIEAGGIKIGAPQIVLEGSATVDIEAGGITTIKGGLVKIN